jgi:hypothetical protein
VHGRAPLLRTDEDPRLAPLANGGAFSCRCLSVGRPLQLLQHLGIDAFRVGFRDIPVPRDSETH